jgi:hypothetical protein
LINGVLIAITLSFTLMFSLGMHTYAFHGNLGIDDNKASQLYQSNPNDPAIVQWKNALQSAINEMDKCFDVQSAITCKILIPTIISNCISHPNTLLACNDSRFPTYPSILNQAEEAQKKAQEAEKQAKAAQKEAQIKENAARLEEEKKSRPLRMQLYGNDILDKCFVSSLNTSSKFEVAGLPCDLEMRSLQSECQLVNNTYNYCKDERFVGYLTQHNILNSTLPR